MNKTTLSFICALFLLLSGWQMKANETYSKDLTKESEVHLSEGADFAEAAVPLMNTYCAYTQTSNTSRYIKNFSTSGGDLNISNLNSGFSTGGYGDYTAMTVSQYIGEPVEFSADFEGGTFGFNIWVDWNDNGQFESSEKMYGSGSYVSSASSSFMVPAGTANGSYRMRVVAHWLSTNPDPCGTNTSGGEAEDYTFMVIDPPSCMAPNQLELNSVSSVNAVVSWNERNEGVEDWTVVYGEIGFDPLTEGTEETVSGSPQATLTGLSPNTEYHFYVKSNCDTDEESSLAGPLYFETGILVDCDTGPTQESFCYGNSTTTERIFSSSDPDGVLNLDILSGQVENSFDTFRVIDTNGATLYSGSGNLAGLSFQSMGPSITVQVVADGSNSCQSGTYPPINMTVACATCENPTISTEIDCDLDSMLFYVDIQVTSFGSADTLDISDNVGSPVMQVTAPGTYSMGPYPYDFDITISVANSDDPNCTVTRTVSSDDCPAPDCIDAFPFCASEDEEFEFPNNQNAGQPPVGPDYACFGSQPNPMWYYLQIGTPGVISIDIVQTNMGGTQIDTDFVMWGPYNSVANACSEIFSGDAPIQWSYSVYGTENIGIGTQGGGTLGACDGTSTPPAAQTGEIYVILLTNYSNQVGEFTLTQTNDGDPGAGATDCSIVRQDEVLGCEGEGVLLETENFEQIAYVWTLYDPINDVFDAIDGGDGFSLEVFESGIYKLQSFSDMGEITEEIFTVLLSPEPELADLEEQYSLCGVDSITLDSTILNSADYGSVHAQWSNATGDNLGSQSTLNVTEPGMYTLTLTTTTLNGEGFPSDEQCTWIYEVEVTFGDFTVSAGNDMTFCGESSYTVTAQIEGEYDGDVINYTWTNQNGDLVGTSQSYEITQSGTYNIEVEIGGCTATDFVTVIFNALPEFDLGDDIATCSLEELFLNAAPGNVNPEEATYIWMLNGEELDANVPMLPVFNYGFGTYTVTVYVEDIECSTTQSINVILYEDFGVELNSDTSLEFSTVFCADDGVAGYDLSFHASVYGIDSEEVTYVWYKNEVEIYGVNGNTLETGYYEEGQFADTYTVEIHMGDCVAWDSLSTSINITLYDHACKITQGISPKNNDGFNDRLDLTFLNDRSGIERLQIFNRYGAKVFDKRNYSNEWHGQDTSGKELATGSYYYILEMKNEDPVFGKVVRDWIYVNQKVN